MHRVESTSNVYKSSDEEFFVIKRFINLTNKVGKAMVPLPRLKANKLLGSMELDSSHQSNLFLKMCSTSLHKVDERAIGRKEMLEWALGIEMTLNSVQDGGI